MPKEIIKYVLRTIRESDYNSWADEGVWTFTNGITSQMPCSRSDAKGRSLHCGHEAGDNFTPGKEVLCVLEEIVNGNDVDFSLNAMALVKSYTPDGRPILGRIIKKPLYKVEKPRPSDDIFDERRAQAPEAKIIKGATQIEIPKELPKVPEPN